MALFYTAGAAALYFAPPDAGSYEVLLWVFWRASHWDLRWQWLPAPGCPAPHTRACPLAAALWAVPRPGLPNIPYTDPHPWGPFSLLGNLLEHDSFWEDFRSAPTHGIYILPSWKTQMVALLLVGLPITANTFLSLCSAQASHWPLDGWNRLMHRSSCSPNSWGALRVPSLGLRWRKSTPFLLSA